MRGRSTPVLAVLAGLFLNTGPVMAAEYNGTLSTAPLDVDVYDQPGGEGTKRPQFLKGGSQVYLQQEIEHWCKVAGDAVPGDVGWIWCGKGDDGQNYALKPVVAEEKPDNIPVVEAKCPEGMEVEVKGPPLICREKVADGATKCTEVTVADEKLVLKSIGQCPAM